MLHAGDQRMFTPPLGTSPSPLGADTGDSVHEKQKGVFSCKYCGESFNNYRALKGHTRVHLGLSPYKCNLCNYSSADKSTLIRHLRTHNGERPFQCLICDYAFTTKANCERHVRKKHEKVEKEEIEKAITYNKYTTDLSTALDNFHSPDTVCKYCGRDFKFFRALKHHLRSHSSCRQKPFMCTKCQVGFSMKANCIRHIQKQHLDVPQMDIEQFIHVNELSQSAADNDETDDILQGSDDVSCSPASTPGLPAPGSTQPVAHPMPEADSIAGAREFPEPLDFSLKNPVMAARLSDMFSPMMRAALTGLGQEDTHEQPIDLTVRRRSLSPSPSSSSVVSPAPSPVNPSTPFKEQNTAAAKKLPISMTPDLPCHLCKKTFGSKEDLLSHLRDVHQVPVNPLSVDSSFPISDSNNNTSATLMSPFLPLPMISPAQLSSIMQARAAVVASAAAFPPHPAFSHIQQKLAYLGPRPIHPSLLQNMAAVKKEPGTSSQTHSSGSASDSSCDLASVNKILDATDAQKIQAFLKPTSAANSGSDDSEPQSATWESADDDSDQSLDQLYAQSLRSAAIKAEQEAVDGVKNDMPRDKHSPEGVAGKAGEGGATPVKKKRNSYADSPHKLNCPYCPRSFPWVSSLNRHLLTHTGQKPFKCPRCPVTFSTKSNRERHLIRKHGVNMLDPASRQTMDRPYKCNLLKHYKERHPGCSPPERYLEKMAADGDASLDASCMDMDKMDEMSLSNMDSNSLNRTENSSMDSSEMVTPLKPPTASSSPKLVEAVVAALLKREPKETTTTLTPTIGHIDDNDEDSSDNNQPQNDLGYPPLSSSAFSGSAERHINPERDNYNVDKITHCWKCGEEFNSRKLLVRHLKEHNIDLPFKCYLCDASYDSRQECLAHQEKMHSSDWSILKDKNGVDSVETYAERLDRIVERNCKTGQFLEEGDDADGLGLAGMEDGQGADAVASDYLQRKVYCSLCPKRFWSLQDLRRHMRSHTGERPFECDKCQKRFTLKHSMMRHRRKHTTGGIPDSPTVLSEDEDSIQGDNPSKGPASNAGTGHRALRQHLALAAALNKPIVSAVLSAAAAEKTTPALPTTVTETKEGGEEDDGEDILHNLLGVESATIDQIFDAKDSAASLLGVKDKVT
ncbi:hypothetical protein BaRGS_00011022 [Batillaria attramentaria]|uniref:C2H2-type domain-containing protein n=1 Tax=Batillaria attramentaria TaxID=370345 RepID=A0ABD0LDI2_9CAEN